MGIDSLIQTIGAAEPESSPMYEDDVLYEFVIKFSDLMQQHQLYGAGVSLSMIERHLLKVIGKYPGITASRIAGMWNRTRGALSPQVKKLELNGYIKKRKHIFNEKTDQLYLTTLGEKINDEHLRTDAFTARRQTQRLLRTCSVEEVAAFRKVMHEYTKLLDDDFRLPPEGFRKALDYPALCAEDRS